MPTARQHSTGVLVSLLLQWPLQYSAPTFFTSNLFFPSVSPPVTALLLALPLGAAEATASVISTSAILFDVRCSGCVVFLSEDVNVSVNQDERVLWRSIPGASSVLIRSLEN